MMKKRGITYYRTLVTDLSLYSWPRLGHVINLGKRRKKKMLLMMRSNLQNWRFYGDKQRDLRMWLVVLLVVWGSPLAWSGLVWYMAYPKNLNLS